MTTSLQVQSIAQNYGVGKRPKKYTCREDFFECIETEEQAYFLGWMLSDGWVCYRSGNNGGARVVCLATKDLWPVEQFRACLGATHPIRQHKNGLYFIEINSRKMTEDLAHLFVVPRKSRITRLPALRADLMQHAVRGVYDGDGCVSLQEKWRKLMFAGSEGMMKDIAQAIYRFAYIDRDPYPTRTGTWILCYSELVIDQIAAWMYKDATLFLNRKHPYGKKWREAHVTLG